MKKFIKMAVCLMFVLTTVFTMTGCKFGGFDYLSFYMIKKITAENISEIETKIDEKTVDNGSYLKYEATYKYDYENMGYSYNTKYDVHMKVNGEAQVGEVFAYIEFRSFYDQEGDEHDRDYLFKYCILRDSEGENYSDYLVAVNVGDQLFGATYSDMVQAIEDSGDYVNADMSNQSMSNALELNNYNGNDYFEILIAWTQIVIENEIVSTNDNPFIFCLHEFNKGSFIGTLNDLNPNSTRGYTLFASGDRKFKIARTYNDSQTKEKYDNASYLKIHDDGTYSYKYIGEYTSNPGRNFKFKKEQELKPLSGVIEIPSWIPQA